MVIFLLCLSPALAADSEQTLAILPFENNSITNPEKYDPLCDGLSVMLITELSNTEAAFRLIERKKIKSLLDEIALGQSGAIDPDTAVKVGQMLGARAIGFGAFMVMGDMVRIDMRIIEVETGALIMAEAITGSAKDFFKLEKKLAMKIARSMQCKLELAQNDDRAGSIEAAVFFAQGVNALENGAPDKARTYFDQAIRLDPAYGVKVEQLQ